MKNFKRFLVILMIMVPVLATPVAAGERFYGRRATKETVVHHPQATVNEELPSSWKSPYFTEVSDQGLTGSCWAFGNSQAVEGNLNKKYSASGNAAISWKNLAYYAWHKSDLSGTGDTMDYNETVYDAQSYNDGPGEADYGGGGGYDDPYGDYDDNYGGRYRSLSGNQVRRNSLQWPGGGDDDPYYGGGDDPYYGGGGDDPYYGGGDDPYYGGGDDPYYGGGDDPYYGGGGGGGGSNVDYSPNGKDAAYLFMGGDAYTSPVLFMQGRCITDDSGNNKWNGDLNNVHNDIDQAKSIGASNDGSYRIKDAYFVLGSNTATVKNMLMTYGAGAISYLVEEDENQKATVYVNNSANDVKQIQDESGMEDVSDHTITLVGWDDSISKSNFRNKPSKDGAWVCINSWGTGDETDKGYTYISYEDASLVYADIMFYDVYKKGDDSSGVPLFTDNSCGMEGSDMVSAVTDDRSRGLAYKADKDLTVKSLSVMTAEDGASYTLTVIGNPSVDNGMIDATKQTALLTQELNFDHAGVHVVKLDKTIGIKSGQTAIFMLKPKKQIKNFMAKAEDITEEGILWEEDNQGNCYYLGLTHYVSDCSKMCLQEQDANNMLGRIDDGDVYYRLFSDNGIESGAATFEGSDFDMSLLRSNTENFYELVVGADKYEVTWTRSVPYTGFPHVLTGTAGKKTADMEVSVKKNGTELPKNEYKVNFKNNKVVAGNGKSPVLYIKLKKNHSKEAKKNMKKQPMNFEIRKAVLGKDVDFSNCDAKFNKYGDKITKLRNLYDAATGKPGKYKFSKNGSKGDIVVDSMQEVTVDRQQCLEVTFRGINNCEGTAVEYWEYDDGNDYDYGYGYGY